MPGNNPLFLHQLTKALDGARVLVEQELGKGRQLRRAVPPVGAVDDGGLTGLGRRCNRHSPLENGRQVVHPPRLGNSLEEVGRRVGTRSHNPLHGRPHHMDVCNVEKDESNNVLPTVVPDPLVAFAFKLVGHGVDLRAGVKNCQRGGGRLVFQREGSRSNRLNVQLVGLGGSPCEPGVRLRRAADRRALPRVQPRQNRQPTFGPKLGFAFDVLAAQNSRKNKPFWIRATDGVAPVDIGDGPRVRLFVAESDILVQRVPPLLARLKGLVCVIARCLPHPGELVLPLVADQGKRLVLVGKVPAGRRAGDRGTNRVVAPHTRPHLGCFLPAGAILGAVVANNSATVTAVVPPPQKGELLAAVHAEGRLLVWLPPFLAAGLGVGLSLDNTIAQHRKVKHPQLRTRMRAAALPRIACVLCAVHQLHRKLSLCRQPLEFLDKHLQVAVEKRRRHCLGIGGLWRSLKRKCVLHLKGRSGRLRHFKVKAPARLACEGEGEVDGLFAPPSLFVRRHVDVIGTVDGRRQRRLENGRNRHRHRWEYLPEAPLTA
mmetsp:Transcript_18612/g.55155  ORF Transcript_18612/g.55155 Transcript_18612/m.55155 type:complete len:543 (+) Transcript_18612:665-2293(+)